MQSKKKTVLLALLLPAFLLCKSIPFIGVSPWVSALVDSLFFLALLTLTHKLPLAALWASAIGPLVDWLQGAAAGYWVPCIAAGYIIALFLFRSRMRPLLRLSLSVLSAYLWRTIAIAAGYVVLKDMTILAAFLGVIRNSWFLFVFYTAAVLLYHFLVKRKRLR